jgi:phosphoribosylformylglycinamidine (FGAM) synthase PurS component
MMKVKIFSSMSDSTLEKDVNEFLANPNIEVIEVMFQAHSFGFASQILYRENGKP